MITIGLTRLFMLQVPIARHLAGRVIALPRHSSGLAGACASGFARAILILCVAPGICVADAEAVSVLAQLPVPPGTDRRLVASELDQQGASVAIVSLTSIQPVQTVLQFFRDHWQSPDGAPGSIDGAAGDWAIVSRLETRHLIIVQMQADRSGGSHGWLSLTSPHDNASLPQTTQPISPSLPPGARLISSTGAGDLPGRSEVRIALSELSPRQVAEFYRRTYGKTWRSSQVHSTAAARTFTLFQPGSTVDIAISAHARGSIITWSRTSSREAGQ